MPINVGYDNRPNISDKQFQQCSGDTITLYGYSKSLGVSGFSSNSGYRISGFTIFHARGTSVPNAIQIGYLANSPADASVTIGRSAEAWCNKSISIGCSNIVCATGSAILGGYGSCIGTGNTNTTMIGFYNNCYLDGTSYIGSVVVPNLIIKDISGSGNALSIDGNNKVCRTTITAGILDAKNGLCKCGNNATLGGALTGNTTITGNYTLNICGSALLNTASGYQISGTTLIQTPRTTASIYVGKTAGNLAATGINNFGAVCFALRCLTTGTDNVAIGYSANQCNTTGNYNIAIGYTALIWGIAKSGNVAIGNSAGQCISGDDNIAIGSLSYGGSSGNHTGGYNIAIGRSSLNTGAGAITGNFNVGLGVNTLNGLTSGSNNIAIGQQASCKSTTGSNNVAIGYCALSSNLTGSGSVAIGTCAGCAELGSNKLYIANCAAKTLIYGEFDNEKLCVRGKLYVSGLTNASKANAIFYDTSTKELTYATAPSGSGGVTGATNLGTGNGTLYTSLNANNIQLKTLSGGTNITITCNGNYVAINSTVGGSPITVTANDVVYTCKNIPAGLSSATNNVLLGCCAGNAITTSSNNVAIGCKALAFSNNSDGYNIAIGMCAIGCCNIASYYNIGIGTNALAKTTTGYWNIGLGFQSLLSNTNGGNNIGIGECAAYSNTNGNNNIAIGCQALNNNTTGSNNIGIGNYAGYSETGSNKLYIANCLTKSLVYGEFDNEKLCVRGKLYVSGLTNASKANAIFYDTATKELTYATAPSGGGGVTGATNLGSGNGTLYTSLNNNNIQLKTLSGGTNVTLTCNGNYIGINATGSGDVCKFGTPANGSVLVWKDTTNAVCGTYLLNFTSSTSVLNVCQNGGGSDFGLKLRNGGGSEGCLHLTPTTPPTLCLYVSHANGILKLGGGSGCIQMVSLPSGVTSSAVYYNTGTGQLTRGAVSGSGISTANNGLIKSGTNVGFGGTLTGDTTINTAGKNLQFSGGSANIVKICKNLFSVGDLATTQNNFMCLNGSIPFMYIMVSTGTTSGSVTLDGSQGNAAIYGAVGLVGQGIDVSGTGKNATFYSYSGICNTQISLSNGKACIFSNAVGFGGIKYNTDYSTNYTARSLVDKAYVDGKTTGGGIGWSCAVRGSTVAGCGAITGSSTLCNSTYFGVSAGTRTTTGSGNVGIGFCALTYVTIGSSNTALGSYALQCNTSSQNTAVGYQALGINAGGYDNTAVGTVALSSNVGGYGNAALGSFALQGNTSGYYNIGIGYQPLFYNTTGHDNIGIGYRTNYCNTTASSNIAIGTSALCRNTASGNTAIGYAALCANIIGIDNIAIGTYVLDANTSGSTNIGIGINTLTSNICGCDNIALGNRTLFSNTCGKCNFGAGCFALGNNLTGNNNIAIGPETLRNTNSGSNNIAFGTCVLRANTSQSGNIGIGNLVLYYSNGGSNNTAVGTLAMFCNTSGNENAAHGYQALYKNQTGCLNTGAGSYTGHENLSGSRNVFVGACAGYNETGSDFLYIANCATTFLIKGDFAGNTICNGGNNTTWNTTSDCRIKENICTISGATQILAQLNPVVYDYTTGYSTGRNWNECKRVCNYGFIAQEYECVFPKYTTVSSEVVNGETISDLKGIDTGHLVPLLIKAIQEQQVQINQLCQKIVALGG